MVGYSLAKFDYPGKSVLLVFILATVMVPFTAILIPLFLIIRGLDWVNTYQALIIPFAMSAFGVFLMRQFMLAVPDDYLDAGRMDGAGEIRIYFRIVLPLVQPALITLAIVVFVANWDEFLWMLVVTVGDNLRTLPDRPGQVRRAVPHALRADDGRFGHRRRAGRGHLPGRCSGAFCKVWQGCRGSSRGTQSTARNRVSLRNSVSYLLRT